jgi:hypothetical protein
MNKIEDRRAALNDAPRLVFHFTFSGLLLIALTACGGGSNGQSAVPTPPPMVTPESGDAWQERYVGTVKIGGVQYFGDAMLTADGLIRLYVGGPYADDGLMPQTVPANSAQLVGTLHGKTNQISGDGLVFGQQCEVPDPIQFCAEIGQASISIAVDPADTFASIFANIQGNILVTTSAGTDTWSLNIAAFSNYFVDLPATQGGLAGNYNEELADFALNGYRRRPRHRSLAATTVSSALKYLTTWRRDAARPTPVERKLISTGRFTNFELSIPRQSERPLRVDRRPLLIALGSWR